MRKKVVDFRNFEITVDEDLVNLTVDWKKKFAKTIL